MMNKQELVAAVYDKLMDNNDYSQLDGKDVYNQWLTSSEGVIDFTYNDIDYTLTLTESSK